MVKRLKAFLATVLVFSAFVMASQAQATAIISITPVDYEFGEVVRGERVETIFQIYNKGTSPLVISLVKTSCGCSATFLEDSTIAPGKSTPLKVTFDSTHFFGKIHKSVFLYSNDPKNDEYEIGFTANVTTLVDVAPDSFNLGSVNLLESKAKTIPFSVKMKEKGGEITGLDYNKNYFDVDCDKDDQSYACSLSVRSGAPSGGILETLLINTNIARQPSFEINIYGRLLGAFDLLPMLVDFGELPSSETSNETVRISSADGKPFKIISVDIDRPEVLSYSLKPMTDKSGFRLDLKFAPSTLTEVVEGKVKVVTDHPTNPEIQIKYQAFVE